VKHEKKNISLPHGCILAMNFIVKATTTPETAKHIRALSKTVSFLNNPVV
jgi:hypothetical protein